jgi:hypothetical protein
LRIREICKRRLWKRSVSLYASSAKGTCREASFTGDPEGYNRKARETGISLHRRPVGELEGWFVYRGLGEIGKDRSVKATSFSLGARGTWREGSYTEDFERHVMEGSGTETFLL